MGGHLVHAMESAGYSREEFVGVTASDGQTVKGCERLETLDIADRAATFAMVKQVKPRAIIHLAAIAEPAQARRNHAQAWAVNFNGVMNLADALLEHSPKARFIFSGSSEAYGASFNAYDGPIPETAALRPMSTYAATKAAADILLGQMAYEGLLAIRFRAFNHTGPGQTESYVVSAFARQIARIEAGLQEPIISVGNLEAERDFLDVRDVVRAYVRAIDAEFDGPGNHVFNLASGKTRSIRSILDGLITLSGIDVDIRQDPDRMRASDVARTLGDTVRAEKLLPQNERIKFQQTLADVLANWRLHFEN